MKKYSLIIIIFIIGIVAVLILGKILNENKNSRNETSQAKQNYDESKIKEIDNSINMTQVRYNSINNVIYYERDYELPDEDYIILEKCINSIQSAMPNRQFVYLRTMKYDKESKTKTYRLAQMHSMMQIDGAELNIDCSKSGAIDNLIGVTSISHGDMITAWANPTDTSFKLTLVEAKDILVKYFYDNESDYNIVKKGNNKVNCRGRLYYYDSKVCQKIEFDIGNSYIIIDANTGEVLNKYFHNGIYMNT